MSDVQPINKSAPSASFVPKALIGAALTGGVTLYVALAAIALLGHYNVLSRLSTGVSGMAISAGLVTLAGAYIVASKLQGRRFCEKEGDIKFAITLLTIPALMFLSSGLAGMGVLPMHKFAALTLIPPILVVAGAGFGVLTVGCRLIDKGRQK